MFAAGDVCVALYVAAGARVQMRQGNGGVEYEGGED